MIEKLEKAEARFVKLEESLADPEIYKDQESYAALMKERKSLAPIIEKYRAYKAAVAARDGAAELRDDATQESELRELAAAEFADEAKKCETLHEELKILLLPKDENDDRNVIVEIRQGTGGEEAALFAAVLYRMYTMYAAARGFKAERIDANETELGGFKEISFMVEGEGAYSRLKFESGVHRVQRVPETEAQGRIQTSTATVAVLPEVEDVEISINPADLRIETCKSSGAGGQHINKTESAVRLTHKPTGIVVECQEERSQFKNRDKAMTMLRTILYDRALRERDEQIAADRRGQVGTGDRSERIRTYHYPQGRVTDHRIGLSLYSLDRFLDGDIDEMINALATAETAKRLNQGGEDLGAPAPNPA